MWNWEKRKEWKKVVLRKNHSPWLSLLFSIWSYSPFILFFDTREKKMETSYKFHSRRNIFTKFRLFTFSLHLLSTFCPLFLHLPLHSVMRKKERENEGESGSLVRWGERKTERRENSFRLKWVMNPVVKNVNPPFVRSVFGSFLLLFGFLLDMIQRIFHFSPSQHKPSNRETKHSFSQNEHIFHFSPFSISFLS